MTPDHMWMLAILFLQAVKAESFWPVTVVGWLTMGGLLLGVGGGAYSYMRALANLNGLGARVTELAESDKALAVIVTRLERVSERLIDDNKYLHEKVGEATRSADGCKDEVVDLRTVVAGHLSDTRREADAKISDVRERVRALEVRVDTPRTR